MITYRGSDVKYSWEHGDGEGGDEPPTGPNIPRCAYVREGNHTAAVAPMPLEPEYEVMLKRWRRDISMERRASLRPPKTRCPLLLVADYRYE